MELLRLKARIKLASKGLNLLKQKRAALIVEFFKINKKALDLRKQLDQAMTKAYNSLAVAEMYEGKIAIESTAYMVNRMKGFLIKTKNVMGVRIPEVSGRDQNFRAIDQQFALMGLSVKVEEAIDNYEAAL